MADGEATGLAPVTESKRPRRIPEEHFDADLEWFRLMGDSAMGERGTLAGTIAQLEHGGPFSGVPNTDLYDDQQIGWGNTAVGHVEKHRWLTDAWLLCSPECRFDLDLRYTAPPANLRSDEGFGARDACPTIEEIQKLGAHETGKPTSFHIRRGTEAQLGEFAALALRHCEDPAKLILACLDPQKGRHSSVITKALKKAKEVSSERHKEWRAAKEQAGRPRERRERRAILPAFNPHESEP